jgi:hypothetical protein
MDGLARDLSDAIGRKPRWTHSPVSIFIASGHAALDFALAISKYFGIPPLIHVPRSLRESMKMQTVKEQFDVILAAEAARGPGTVEQLHKAEAEPEPEPEGTASPHRHVRARHR